MKSIRKRIAGLLALAMVLTTCMSAFAGTYSLKWTTANGQWQAVKNGVLLKSTWILDDECDVQGGLYYLADENGNLVTDKLIVDSHGHYFTFNDQHDGHYGAMITTDGRYWGVDLKFSQVHDGSFGSIINQEAIDALKRAYGVREFPNLTNSACVRLSQGTSSGSSSSGGGSSTTSKYWVTFDANGVMVDEDEFPGPQQVKRGGLVTEPSPATPSDLSGEKYCLGWFLSEDDTTTANQWDFAEDRVYGRMTLYAGWVDAYYDLSFEANAPAGCDVQNMPEDTEVKGGEKIAEVATPTDANRQYYCEGWYTDTMGAEKWDFDDTIVTDDVILYAFWTDVSKTYYTVEFSSSYGVAPSDQKIEENAYCVEPSKPVDPDGEYVFAGWYVDADFTQTWDFDSNKVVRDTKLYAQWLKKQEEAKTDPVTEETTGTVEFESEDDVLEASMPAEAAKELIPEVVDGKTVKSTEIVSTVLTLDVDLREDEVSEDSVTYDISLSQTSTVYDKSTGKEKRSETTEVEDAQGLVTISLQIEKELSDVEVYHSGVKMTENPAAGQEGYTYNKTSGVLTIMTETFSPFEVRFTKAVVTDQYTLTYDGNGATSGEVPGAADYAKGDLVTVEGAGDLVKTGYTFGGWNTKADGSGDAYAAGTSFIIDGNMTLYAKWNGLDQYTVTFDVQGHGTAPTAQTVYAGSTASRPENDPTDVYYTFKNWYQEAACTNLFDFTAAINANTTIYADWEAKGEAAIGTQIYTTLAAAITAANADDTIILLKDIEISSTITVDKAVTIDGNGFKATVPETALLGNLQTAAFKVTADGVTFDDVDLLLKDGDDYHGTAVLVDAANFTFKDGSVVGGYKADSYAATNGFSTCVGILLENSKSNATITGNTIVGCEYPVQVCAYSAPISFSSNEVEHNIYFACDVAASGLTVTGNVKSEDAKAPDGVNNVRFVLYAGAANDTLARKLLETGLPIYTTTDFVNYKTYFVAKLGSVLYGKIADALSAAETGDTVEVLADSSVEPTDTVELPMPLKAGVTVKGQTDTDGKPVTTVTNTVTGTLDDITLENFKFAGTGDALRWCYVNSGKTTTIKNCEFAQKGQYGIHFDENAGSVVVENSKITGTVAINKTLENITFTGCEFAGRSESGHCNINIYNKASFTNCTFAQAYTTGASRGILMPDETGSQQITMTNCSVEEGTGTLTDVFRRDWALGLGIIDATGNVTDGFTAGTFVTTDANPSTKIPCAAGYAVAPVEDALGSKYTVVETWEKYAADSYATPVDVDGKIVTITSAEELALYAKEAGTYVGYTVKLTADIDLAGHLWKPINISGGTVFDGGSHTVSNVTVKGTSYVGLFGSVSCSTVKNVTVKNAIITGYHYGGVIAGHGLCGHFVQCAAKDSKVTLTVELANGTYDNGDKAGGICGYLSGESDAEVTACSVYNCTITGYRDIGGAVGMANGTATVTTNSVTSSYVYCKTTPNPEGYTSLSQYNADQVVGRKSDAATINGNVPYNVTVSYLE